MGFAYRVIILALLSLPACVEAQTSSLTADRFYSISDEEADGFAAEDWVVFGRRVVAGLSSDASKVQEGCIQAVIRYGSKFSVPRAGIFVLADTYRQHENPAVRRMSVVALMSTGDRWARDYLKRAYRYEEDESVRQTIAATLGVVHPSDLANETNR